MKLRPAGRAGADPSSACSRPPPALTACSQVARCYYRLGDAHGFDRALRGGGIIWYWLTVRFLDALREQETRQPR